MVKGQLFPFPTTCVTNLQHFSEHGPKMHSWSALLLVLMVTVMFEFGGTVMVRFMQTSWVKISFPLLTNEAFISLLLMVIVGLLRFITAISVSKITSLSITSSVNGSLHTSHCMFTLLMSRVVPYNLLNNKLLTSPHSVTFSKSQFSTGINFSFTNVIIAAVSTIMLTFWSCVVPRTTKLFQMVRLMTILDEAVGLCSIVW